MFRENDDPFHEAAEALRAMGHRVEPTGDDLGLWLVDGEELSDADLIALAARMEPVAGPETIQ